jgi:ABC-type antimicrobial peptide transport system permease subunit
VAIVNEALATAMGHGSETGWRIRRCAACDPLAVVGIVEDGKYQTLAEQPSPAMFFPILQQAELTTMLLVRSSRPQAEVAGEIRARLQALDADMPLYSVGGLDEVVGFVFVPAWAATITLNVFGALAAMLVLTGVYGVAAYSVTRRAREISIRVAVGARPAHVVQAVLGRTAGLLLAGSLVGIGRGAGASRVLASVVYQATPADPGVLIAAVATMGAIGLSASWLPARRALRLDPVRALRED